MPQLLHFQVLVREGWGEDGGPRFKYDYFGGGCSLKRLRTTFAFIIDTVARSSERNKQPGLRKRGPNKHMSTLNLHTQWWKKVLECVTEVEVAEDVTL